MKFANVKALATKAMVAAVAAGALLFAAPTKSQAQVIVSARFGYPAPVVRPFYGRPGPVYFDRRAEFFRHEEWARGHRFYGYRR